MNKTGALATTQNETTAGMTPRQIKAELVLRGIPITEIADQAGVTVSAVTQTINRYPGSRYKGLRVRQYIAQALEKEVGDIWP